ncbi:M16 family metallopeptidase [Agrilutibacter solisilvae]|uniref:Insulinase family protein n=1 Tax=Agrilutibacter solisilvae TaxID=2763317 RepID=A0A974Y073_9GAMM|nr:pitrilysin family protein [Lysobacter solisilvae]QSX78914.1 insulinase family protein [Lysobacter solisilvae]
MRRAALFVAVCLALSPAAFAGAPAKHAPAKPVPAAELARSVDIPSESFTLDNGLRVVVHTDRKAPVVAVQAWYNVGSKDEPQGKTGFAHLFEHIGLFNPTENLPGGLMQPLRAIGATDWNGTTWFDRTNFFQTVPTAALEQALYMESDRMGHLLGALNQERLDNQRGVVQNEKRQGDNQPYGLVEYAQLETLFPPGHPYHHSTIGSMADLDSASLEDLRQWHRDNYGPNNAVLVLAGDVDVATAKTLVQKYFGDIARGAVNEPAPADVPTLPARVDKTLHDRVANTRLYRTWIVPGLLDATAADLDIAATVLGGLASSRLDNALVRGDESAVAATASYQPFHRLGMFELSVDVKPGQDVAAVSARLDALVNDFIAQGPTQDEVARVTATRMAERIRALEPVGGFTGKAVVLAEGQLYAGDPSYYRRELAAYGEATPASVRKAMAQWLSRPVLAITVAPGEREPYAEAAATRPAPKPPAPLAIAPRAPMPGVGVMKALDFPTVERAHLRNGIEVVYARSGAVPMTQVAVEFDAGVAADPGDALGTQKLVLSLLDQGTASRNAVQIAEENERLGATLATNAGLDRTAVMLGVVSPNLAPGLELLADVVRNPAFRAEDLERMRAQQLANIDQEKTSPNGIGGRALPGILYGAAHPYGRPFSGLGDPAAVKTLTRDDLTAFHQRWLRPDNARVFVVSDRPLAELQPLLDAQFGAWAAPATPKGQKVFPDALPAPTPRIVLIDRPQSPQSLILGAAVLPVSGRDDLVAFNAANEVIGNGFLSRINQDIRETRGWSYGLNGRITLAQQRSPYIISAPVQANRTGESIQVLIDQYRHFLSDQGVTAAEQERTINGNVRSLPGGFETSANVLNALRTNVLFERPDDYWETLGPRYQALSTQAMDDAARRIIDDGDFVWVVVGDAASVKPQLEKLGLPVEVRQAM